MCDGYSGYTKVSDVKRTACWAHIRRYLTDAIPKGKALDYTQPSVQEMLYINQLFHLEDVIRSKYSSFDAIKKARLEKEKPVVEGFLSWLDQQNPPVEAEWIRLLPTFRTAVPIFPPIWKMDAAVFLIISVKMRSALLQ